MAALAIAALGSLGYQYQAARQARVANAQITATKTALLLLEDWKSTGGTEKYNPLTLGLGFEATTDKVSKFGYGNGLGSALNEKVYGITVDNVSMGIVLKWKDIDNDSTAQMTLRQLTVIVKFEEEAGITANLSAHNPAIVLTTYTRRDATGG